MEKGTPDGSHNQPHELTPVEQFARQLSQLSAQDWKLLDLSFGLSNGDWHKPKQISHRQLMPLPSKEVKQQRQALIHKLAGADITHLALQGAVMDKLQQELQYRTNSNIRINRSGAILLLINVANHQDNNSNAKKLRHKLRKLKPK